MTTPTLFQPAQVGDMTLSHRVVMAPLTRNRANVVHTPGDLMVEYYTQRASVPGTLIIAEATFVSGKAGGKPHTPGVWNDEQVVAWKKVVDAVHKKGCFIYLQIWALGRAALLEELEKDDPSFSYVSASDIHLTGWPKPPRPLTITEIREYIQLFASAASNAVHRAGFDGVEIHAAHGYLIDQFLQYASNKRTDDYGGSIENRCRFALEIVDAVTKTIGPTKTGIRFSPWNDFQDMRMHMEDPVPTFSYIISRLADQYQLAYLHLVEPRIAGSRDRKALAGESNDVFRAIWAPRTLIVAGGFTREEALRVSENTGNLIAFGRAFIPNPDLPLRLMKNIPLAVTNRDKYYTIESPEGYTDWPFADTEKLESGRQVHVSL